MPVPVMLLAAVLKVRVEPESALIRTPLAPSVTGLCQVPLPTARRAPSLTCPVPFKVSASAATVKAPSWRAAPAVTVVPAAAVPSARALFTFKTPALTVVSPV